MVTTQLARHAEHSQPNAGAAAADPAARCVAYGAGGAAARDRRHRARRRGPRRSRTTSRAALTRRPSRADLADALGILQNNTRVLAAPLPALAARLPPQPARRAAPATILMLAATRQRDPRRHRARSAGKPSCCPTSHSCRSNGPRSRRPPARGCSDPRPTPRSTDRSPSSPSQPRCCSSPQLLSRPGAPRTGSQRRHRGQTDAGIVREPISTVGAGGCFRRGLCAGAGHTASRSRAPFPSRARFRSAAQPALTGLHQPPPTPTRRGSHEQLPV